MKSELEIAAVLTRPLDSANHYFVAMRGDLVVVMRPVMGAISKAEAVNLAVWLKVLADPGGGEFARVEREVKSS